MPTVKDVAWFKSQFAAKINPALNGTPLTIDHLTAIALQETGYIWQVLRRNLPTAAEVLALCVGDTIDARPNGGGRSAFPRNKAELLAKPNGDRMFAIARKSLEDMARFITSYQPSVANPNKFCRGFGIFQYDLQFFRDDPDYFLERRWGEFGACLDKCVTELKDALARLGYAGRASLTDEEASFVAIVYNIGFSNFRRSRGLRQGHQSDGKFYGENIFAFISLARSVDIDEAHPVVHPHPPVHPSEARIASYYPHWGWEDGDITREMLGRLPAGALIGVHHGDKSYPVEKIREILDFPGKEFQISWYAECNIHEANDDIPVGIPVANRIQEARDKQALLRQSYPEHRFANLIELDAAREKKEGDLVVRHGNKAGIRPADWLADAKAVKEAGFRYLAKSPRPEHVDELIARFGADFVPRLVFEDVTGPDGDPGYRTDALALAARGEVMTLVMHKEALGGFGGTTRERAVEVMTRHFSGPGQRVEVYFGLGAGEPRGFELLRPFPAPPTPGASGLGPSTAPARRRYKVIARNGLRLREGPGTAFPSSRTMPFGTLLYGLQSDGGWVLVDLEGDGLADGHMLQSYLEVA